MQTTNSNEYVDKAFYELHNKIQNKRQFKKTPFTTKLQNKLVQPDCHGHINNGISYQQASVMHKTNSIFQYKNLFDKAKYATNHNDDTNNNNELFYKIYMRNNLRKHHKAWKRQALISI